MRQIKKGSTDRSVIIRIIDSADGTPETGVTFETSGIDLWYRREGATVTSITEATLATTDAAHSDGGIIHLGNGYYRLDLPDAAWATGANHIMIGGTVTGMIVIGQEIQLVNFDPEDTIRLGLTALPNAAADSSGGLPISDAGGLDLDSKLANTNEVTAARMGALTDWINGGRLDAILDSIVDYVDSLETRLTATRAGYLDYINTIYGKLPSKTYITGSNNSDGDIELNEATGNYGGTISDSSGVTTLLTRITAAVALNSDMATLLSRIVGTIASGTHNPQTGDSYVIVNNGTYGNSAIKTLIDAVTGYVDDLETRLTAVRAGYLDNLSAGAVAQASVCTEARLAELGSTNIPADIDSLLTRLTALRSGYLDNLSGGAAATVAGVTAVSGKVDTVIGYIDTEVGAIKTVTDKIDGMLELDGDVYRFTENAVENAPTGSGGFTSGDRSNLESITGVTGIMATMYENAGAYYRWLESALEEAPGGDATAANQATIIADIGTIDTIIDALKVIADKYDAMVEDDDAVSKFTANALEESPVATDSFTETDRANLEAILADTGTDGVKVIDVETGLTFKHAMQLVVALAFKMDGGGGTTIHARDYADSKNRITWIVDDNGNRTGVTFSFD